MADSINLIAVLVAAVAQFMVGAIWYMPLFGKLWGKIHGFDDNTKEDQADMQQQMLPLLVVQLLMAGLTAYVLAWVVSLLPGQSPYALAAMMWLGFAVPTQVSAVLFGGTEPKWIVKKITVMAGGAFVCFMVAAFVISWLQ